MNVKNIIFVEMEHVLILKEALLVAAQKVTHKAKGINNVVNVNLDSNLEISSNHAKI